MTQFHFINNCLYTAIVTPFVHNDIDWKSFEALLKDQEKAGNGVVILGSTGENLSLSLEEKKELVNFVQQQKLKVPIMVGVPGQHLPSALEWIQWCNSNEALSSYLMVTPLYMKPGVEGQKLWFESLLNASTKPCMLYNVPSRTGIKLNLSAMIKLKDHSNFWAIKEASGSITEFESYSSHLPNQMMYCGDDSLMPYFALRGAKGLVSVASNVWPNQVRKVVERCLEQETNELFPLWSEASNSLFCASNPIPVKVLLHEQKKISAPELRLPLTHLEVSSAQLEELKSYDQRMMAWKI